MTGDRRPYADAVGDWRAVASELGLEFGHGRRASGEGLQLRGEIDGFDLSVRQRHHLKYDRDGAVEGYSWRSTTTLTVRLPTTHRAPTFTMRRRRWLGRFVRVSRGSSVFRRTGLSRSYVVKNADLGAVAAFFDERRRTALERADQGRARWRYADGSVTASAWLVPRDAALLRALISHCLEVARALAGEYREDE